MTADNRIKWNKLRVLLNERLTSLEQEGQQYWRLVKAEPTPDAGLLERLHYLAGRMDEVEKIQAAMAQLDQNHDDRR